MSKPRQFIIESKTIFNNTDAIVDTKQDPQAILAEWAAGRDCHTKPQRIRSNDGEIDLEVVDRCGACNRYILDDAPYHLTDDGTFCEQCWADWQEDIQDSSL